MKNKFDFTSVRSWLYALFVISLPFQKIFPSIIIALIVGLWVLQAGYKNLIIELKSNIFFQLIIAFFLLHVIGMIYSSNQTFGWNDISGKLSLLIFPCILFAGIKIDQHFVTRLFKFFICALIVSILICLVRATVIYFRTGKHADFFYTDFSIFIHPTYFSMYAAFALFILLHNVLTSGSKKYFSLPVSVTFIIIFSLCIFLLSSKAGMIVWSMIVIAFAVYELFLKKFMVVLILLASLPVFFLSQKFVIPSDANRIMLFEEAINEKQHQADSQESTNLRMFIWKASFGVIENNFWIGVGTGDIKDELMKEYENRSMHYAKEKNLNTHNQYLQSFIALGLLSFILWALMMALPLIKAIKEKKMILLAFVIITGFNFLFESMIETQSGVLFYSFFYSLLLSGSDKNNSES